MSEDAVELIRRTFEEAVAAGGGEGVLDALDPRSLEVFFARLDPEVEFHEDPNFPEAGVYRGLDETRGYLTRFSASFDEVTFRAEDYIDCGDRRVLALFTLTTRGKGSGAITEARPGWLYELRDERVVRIDAWLDRETALREAGVERD